VFVRIDSHQS